MPASSRRSFIPTLLAAVSAGGALWVAVSQTPPNATDLPVPAHIRHREVFPDAELNAVAIGTPVAAEYARFGRAAPTPRQLHGERCFYFRYDPDLLDEPTSLVLLVRDGLIRDKWLVASDTSAPFCHTLPAETVDLTGYYDSAWCCSGGIGWALE